MATLAAASTAAGAGVPRLRTRCARAVMPARCGSATAAAAAAAVAGQPNAVGLQTIELPGPGAVREPRASRIGHGIKNLKNCSYLSRLL